MFLHIQEGSVFVHKFRNFQALLKHQSKICMHTKDVTKQIFEIRSQSHDLRVCVQQISIEHSMDLGITCSHVSKYYMR